MPLRIHEPMMEMSKTGNTRKCGIINDLEILILKSVCRHLLCVSEFLFV